MSWHIDTYYAFTRKGAGGNPAGVCLCESFPANKKMTEIAAQMGFSETVFAKRYAEGFRVRYFSPMAEVDFCGHATLALGKALAKVYGDGNFTLQLNNNQINVSCTGATASLKSPPASARSVSNQMLQVYLTICGLTHEALDSGLPAGLAYAGNQHLLFPMPDADAVDKVSYDFETAKVQMTNDNITTLVPLYISNSHIYMRNLFAAGNVYEDPATGAAAAAVAGYLRDHNALAFAQKNSQILHFSQGDAMKQPCTLTATLTAEPDSPVTVSGEVVGPISQPVII